MIKLRKLKNNPLTALKQIGWDWMLGEDTIPYLTDEVVEIEEGEADEYFIAANELYEMFINAGQYVIDNNKFEELGIPENLIDLVKYSWENDKTWHLYGRFDLSGGTDGKPIKLIEFNADTATCIPETAVVQYAHLKANELEEQFQFNGVFEAFVEQFKCIKAENGSFSPTLLISTLRDAPEDEANVSVIGEAAREAGFEVDFEYIDAVEFSETDGI
ncbi:glutathionylspermidine synthase family protein [Pseudarcicella hirudinis]